MRIRLGDALYRQEYCDAFVSAPGSVFDADLLAHMFGDDIEEEPDEPLWTGVKEMSAQTHGVQVRFHDGIDPSLYETGGSKAACLLYKPN